MMSQMSLDSNAQEEG